jgi:hypothetical protein
MIAIPAVYIVDKADNVVGMLQGDIKVEQLQKLLK